MDIYIEKKYLTDHNRQEQTLSFLGHITCTNQSSPPIHTAQQIQQYILKRLDHPHIQGFILQQQPPRGIAPLSVTDQSFEAAQEEHLGLRNYSPNIASQLINLFQSKGFQPGDLQNE